MTSLAQLLRTRQVSSVELTKLYLERLHLFDKALNCVVTFTDDLALRQAQRADDEIAAGKYRGPLHGVPWGAKDLIAVPGYKTTWGATPFENQVLDVTATVAERLEAAGAVLLAKMSLGALAWGDGWFRGMTRNPWNPDAGSSGSSAGSASATAAGLLPFALGSETLGSIISPCRVCGCTGLRPTFGRISRFGCMALAWSMDKIGPISRSVEDCALVFDAIHGADGRDPSAVDRPFAWPSSRDVKSLRVGYFERKNSGTDKEPAARRGPSRVENAPGVGSDAGAHSTSRKAPGRCPDRHPGCRIDRGLRRAGARTTSWKGLGCGRIRSAADSSFRPWSTFAPTGFAHS